MRKELLVCKLTNKIHNYLLDINKQNSINSYSNLLQDINDHFDNDHNLHSHLQCTNTFDIHQTNIANSDYSHMTNDTLLIIEDTIISFIFRHQFSSSSLCF